MLTAAQTRGAAAGGIILTFFGSLWYVIALLNWPAHPVWSIPAASLATIALLLLCVVRIGASRNIPSVADPTAAVRGKRVGILFGIIFGIEAASIGVAAGLLGSHRLGLWIPFAAALIVGVHFLPLAHVFDMPVYYWTGFASVIGVLGCLFIQDVHARVLSVGLVMAAVLWVSVIVLLLQTRIAPSA